MNERLKWWNKKIEKYSTKKWINLTTIFAKFAIKYFPKQGTVLELGAGHGQDTRFFASEGYHVVSTDFVDTALKYIKGNIPNDLKHKIKVVKLDLSKKFPFDDKSFDVKHFFSTKYMREKAKNFECVVLDDKGTTHKDNEKGVFNLIRFIGGKPL